MRLLLPRFLARDLAAARGPVYRGEALLEALRGREELVCIGDVVSRYCVRARPRGLVAVVDGATMREPGIEPPGGSWSLVVLVSNHRGTISPEARSLVCGLSREPRGWSLVLVDGEEDLLALPAIECSGAPVVYGLPGVGGVVVEPSPQARLLVSMWLTQMTLLTLKAGG